ncbi:hypothetical protein AB0K14_08840 [Actinosynnema sp. NPDC050801]|uniref:hypothetical protein n=1 Tax=unclassified Actinosynnema TaxID=2637065 RepID=UPI0033C7CC49
MIWVAWRQHRAVLLSLAAYAVVFTGLVVFMHVRLASQLDAEEVAACFGQAPDRFCEDAKGYWDLRARLFNLDELARAAVFGFAALAGAFVGAPMFAREWEQRTHLLALSQSISPRRWFTTRVAVVLAATVLGAALLGAAQWWATMSLAAPLDVWKRLQPRYFEAQPVALIGYTLFAVALGIAAGLLLRRTLPAMAVTLVGVLGAVYAVRMFARPNYTTPVVATIPFDDPAQSASIDPGRWSLAQGFSDLDGRFVEDEEAAYEALSRCEQLPGEPGDARYVQCAADSGLTGTANLVHPGSRFWAFQFIEFGLFALAAAALIALSLWWLRKRST